MGKIYRDIEYVPRIWGIRYTNLFVTIILALFYFLVLHFIGKFVGLLIGFMLSILTYLFIYAFERVDRAELFAKIRKINQKRITPYELSGQNFHANWIQKTSKAHES